MARIRVLIRIPSADAYELKAQALNNDPRLKAAGISSLKFESDTNYIVDGGFSSGPASQTAPEPASAERESDLATVERLRVVVRLLSEDAYELKAQVLNNDPRLKSAGISAFKFQNEKQYIVDGEFSHEPPDITSEPAPIESESSSAIGPRLRVALRLLSEDAYELKAQALNNDPRLRAAGISALKFESDTNYIVDGKFSHELPAQATGPALPEKQPQTTGKWRVYLRMPTVDAYTLLAGHLNGDPHLKEAGITGVNLVKGGGIAGAQEPVTPPVKKRSRLTWGVTLGGIALLLAVGAVFAAPRLAAPPSAAPTAVVLPTGTATATGESIPVTGPTSTVVVATRTRTAVPVNTQVFTPPPTSTLSCPIPRQGTILQQLNCRWGPGGVYIYADGAYAGETVQILGRQETALGSWINVRTPRDVECWISARPEYVEAQGDIACVEGDFYPDRARFPVYSEFPDRFPPPSDVKASRQGNQISIYWTGIYLAPGDRPDEGLAPYAPIYLVETWTCQAGKLVLTPMGVYRDPAETGTFFAGVPPFTDEAGCSEPSFARVWLAHKDGYVGPVTVTWQE